MSPEAPIRQHLDQQLAAGRGHECAERNVGAALGVPMEEKALRRVLAYVEEGIYQQRGLGLVGPVGCGKTSLVVTAYKLVAPRLLDYPAVPAAEIQFVSVLDLFDVFRGSFDEDKRTGEPLYA